MKNAIASLSHAGYPPMSRYAAASNTGIIRPAPPIARLLARCRTALR